jgi:hypothetical protein
MQGSKVKRVDGERERKGREEMSVQARSQKKKHI